MKIEKRVLGGALRVLGKVACQNSPVEEYRAIRFQGGEDSVSVSATDGREWITFDLPCQSDGTFDFAIELKTLRDRIRHEYGETIELTGKSLPWTDVAPVPVDAVQIVLPENFTALLELAAQLVDRESPRLILQGMNLSSSGITATNGRELLHLPLSLQLKEDITLPFPSALLTARIATPGMFKVWQSNGIRMFRIEIGNLCWQGMALSGTFPDWRQVIPSSKMLAYQISIHEPEKILSFLKTVPDHEPNHGIELSITPAGLVIIPVNYPDMQLEVKAELTGQPPRVALALNKYILMRMLQQGYTRLSAHSDDGVPVVASGGRGQYIAMPIRILPKANIKEKQAMEPVKTIKPDVAAVEVNPMEELNSSIEELRGKLRTLFEESALLSRKVKEAVLQQKQREREFIQAKRAIERIRMAI